jgi:flagellar export protein FliJ
MDPKVLRMLIDRAQAHRDEAAGEAAGARRERDAAAATLRTLTDYREESLGRAPVRAGLAVGVDQLRTAVQFDARLVAAIHQQFQQHARTQADAAAQDAALADRQRRLKALETLALRRAQAASRLESRREQHALDEHATHLAARRRPGKDRP